MKRLPPFLPPLLVLLAVLPAGCGDDPAGPVPDPPPFPPPAAFAFDVSFFEDSYIPPASAGGVLHAAHGSNFGFAAVRAMEIGLPLEGRLALHSAVFEAAATAPPVYREGFHVWDVRLPAPAEDAVRLEGSATGNGIVWIARRDSGEGLRPWFEAVVDTAGLAGEWTFRDAFDAATPVLYRQTWTGRAGQTGDLVLTFTWPEGHVLHLDKQSWEHDLRWEPVADDQPWRTHWNAESQIGWLIAPDFSSGVKVCWGSHLDDTSCLELPGS